MRRSTIRRLLVLFYAIAGMFHLVAPARFLPIMPDWVPEPRAVILFTGVCELSGALGLMLPPLRWWSGVMLALYAVCVFPANLHHAFGSVEVPGLPSSWWYHGPRLALQPVLVWAALYAGRVADWPFCQAAGSAPAGPRSN